jgi:hypothetical protein
VEGAMREATEAAARGHGGGEARRGEAEVDARMSGRGRGGGRRTRG